MARTKIIATPGPATADKAVIGRLILLGVNVFRLNFSHGDHAFHAKLIKDARSIAEQLNRPIALLQDISGPKIRVSPTEPLQLIESDLLYVWRKETSKEFRGHHTELNGKFRMKNGELFFLQICFLHF